MDDVTREIEQEREEIERERNRPPKVSNSQVDRARIVWIGGSILIDGLTAWLIYTMTGYWYYALIWVVAGAGGLLYSEDLKTRIGNNPEQQEYADRGVKVSAIAVFVMAVLVGGIFVTGYAASWVDAILEAAAVGLFFFHLYQSYQYHNLDDEVIARNEEARAEERNKKREREIHRAARIVERKRKQLSLREKYRKEYGGAFDAALGKDKPVKMELEMRSFALDDENPTTPPRR
jgi:hypothetical protein